VVKNEKINEIERTRFRSPPRATSFFKKNINIKNVNKVIKTKIGATKLCSFCDCDVVINFEGV
jgi:hypothetical protein